MEEQMKLTIVGPLDSELLQDVINGEPVSFQGRKGYKIYVDGAYESVQKMASLKADHVTELELAFYKNLCKQQMNLIEKLMAYLSSQS